MSEATGLVVGIDASRNRSGGAQAHLTGILREGYPHNHGIREVHVWAFKLLLDSLPDENWLIKHHPKELEQSLPKQLWWQATKLSGEAAAAGCDILFTTDASTLCRFTPMVVLSQDMLSYEPGVMRYFGYTKARLRLWVILYVQNRALRLADGVIFLTKYAAKTIQQSCGTLSRVAYIPHGIGADFRRSQAVQTWPAGNDRPVRCLYVSNAAMYKHQWMVVRAMGELRGRGYKVSLLLVGGGTGRARILMDEAVAEADPRGEFIECQEFVPHDEIPGLLGEVDLFIFASSCENLPVTLLEAMAAGLPIACSNRGPMPEILEDGGVYFDPESSVSISAAVEQIILNRDLRVSIAKRAMELSGQYSWSRCADETWRFITETCRSINA